MGEREPAGSGRASRDAAYAGRASRPPRTTRTATQQRVHLTRSRGAYAGEWEDVRRACVGCTRASGVIIQRRGVQSPQGKWHRAGLACSTGQACSAGQVCAGARLVCSTGQACSVVGLAAGTVCRQLSFGEAFGAGRHDTTSFREGTARAGVTLLWG